MKVLIRTIKLFCTAIGFIVVFGFLVGVLTHYTIDRLSDNAKIIVWASILLSLLLFASYKIAQDES